MTLLRTCRQLARGLWNHPKTPSTIRSRIPQLEVLEDRYAPATLLNPTKLTYQDADGDKVTVTFSKAILTSGNVDAIFTFDTGPIAGTGTKQQLQRIDLTGVASAAGTTLTTSAVRSPVNGGDGFAHVGEIEATGLDLGAVGIDGDLGRILAGDLTPTTAGLKGLTVLSLGRHGTATGAFNLNSAIQGNLSFLQVKTDIKEASLLVQGSCGSVTIGGSLIGGAGSSDGFIGSGGSMGAVRVGGSVQGGDAEYSGSIFCGGSMASLTIGGSLIGGAGNNGGRINTVGAMGPVQVGGNVQGGTGGAAGFILSGSTLASLTVGGSLLGGNIASGGAMGAVQIKGNVQGGAGESTGGILSASTLTSVTIGGSLIGGPFSDSGAIRSLAALGALRIAGNIQGGSAAAGDLERTGYVEAQRIGTLVIGGSLIAGVNNTVGTFQNNGAIRVADDIGKARIGNLIGNSTNPVILSARGRAAPSATTDLAIGKLTVKGRVDFAQILAGFDPLGSAANADAQIGPVVVGGDWIASSIVAGALPGDDGFFGNDDLNEGKMTAPGVKDEASVSSRIASLTIGGQALGTQGGADHFGMVAERVGALSIGGTIIPLSAGNSNDDYLVGITGDFKVNEV